MELPKKVVDRVRAAMQAAAARVFRENSLEATLHKTEALWDVNDNVSLFYSFHLSEEKKEEK